MNYSQPKDEEAILIWGCELKEAVLRKANVSTIGYFEWDNNLAFLKDFITTFYAKKSEFK